MRTVIDGDEDMNYFPKKTQIGPHEYKKFMLGGNLIPISQRSEWKTERGRKGHVIEEFDAFSLSAIGRISELLSANWADVETVRKLGWPTLLLSWRRGRNEIK